MNTNSTTFDVIYTFADSPQLAGEVLFAGRPSEAQVLKGLLNGLSTKETAKLVKISLCQLHCEKDGVLPWVERSESQCKYYFDQSEGGSDGRRYQTLNRSIRRRLSPPKIDHAVPISPS